MEKESSVKNEELENLCGCPYTKQGCYYGFACKYCIVKEIYTEHEEE